MPHNPENQPQLPSEESYPSMLLHGYDFELITGQSNPDLARAIGTILSHIPDEPILLFKDGEIKPKISGNLRRKHAIIIESTSPPHVNDYYIGLLLMIDAARRASADEITVVLPYFGYARQDRKDEPRVPISASALANILISTGADRIVTLDIHSEQAQGYIQEPWDNLYASFALVPEILKDIDPKNLVVVSPDIGAAKRTAKYAKAMGTTNIAIVYKERDLKPNSRANAVFLIGNVEGKDVLITDDLIAGGSTMVDAARVLKENGAQRIFGSATHGLFLGEAIQTIEASPIERIYVTDSIVQRNEIKTHPKIRIVSVAGMLAEAIRRIHTGLGLSDLFE